MPETKRRRLTPEDVRNNARLSGGGKRYLRLPQGVEVWYPENAEAYLIDFYPYVISIDNHPDRSASGKCVKGDIWYKLPYKSHRNIGPNNEEIVCPTTFGLPCPICEERGRLAKNYKANEDAIKLIKATNNVLYNIKNPDTGNYAIYDANAFKFSEVLEKELTDGDESNLFFWDINQNGRTVKARFGKHKYSEGDFLKADRIDFVTRPDMIDDEDNIFKNVVNLDTVLQVRSYDEIKKLFLQIGWGRRQCFGEDGNAASTAATAGKAEKAEAGGRKAPGGKPAPTAGGAPPNRPATQSGKPGGSNTGTTAAGSGKRTTPPPAQETEDADNNGDGGDGGESGVLKDGDAVTFSWKGRQKSGTVFDVDGETITIDEDGTGKRFDVNVDDVAPAEGGGEGVDPQDGSDDSDDDTPAPAPKAKAGKGKPAPAPVAPKPKFKVGDRVQDDLGNVGKLKSINGTDCKIKTDAGKTVDADLDDLVAPEADAGDGDDGGDADGGDTGEGEGETAELAVGDKVVWADSDGDDVEGRITKIKRDADGNIQKYKVSNSETPEHWQEAENVRAADSEE